MMTVTVYTKPACPACDTTKRHLGKLGIPFSTAPITPEVIDHLDASDITSAPIVHVERGLSDEMWGGYRPDRIERLVAETREAKPDEVVESSAPIGGPW